jgi:hypothetical protein
MRGLVPRIHDFPIDSTKPVDGRPAPAMTKKETEWTT